MVNMLALSVVDRGFDPDRVQPKTIKLVFVSSPLSIYAALRRKSKECLALNQDNASEWGHMYIHGLLFQ